MPQHSRSAYWLFLSPKNPLGAQPSPEQRKRCLRSMKDKSSPLFWSSKKPCVTGPSKRISLLIFLTAIVIESAPVVDQVLIVHLEFVPIIASSEAMQELQPAMTFITVFPHQSNLFPKRSNDLRLASSNSSSKPCRNLSIWRSPLPPLL